MSLAINKQLPRWFPGSAWYTAKKRAKSSSLVDLTLARWCAQATRWLWTQAKARLPLSGHKTQSKFRRFPIQDKSDWGMQDELQRWGHQGMESMWVRPGWQRGYWCLVIFIRAPHTPTLTCQQIYFNHIYPSLPRKEVPSKLVLPIWLWKAPPKPWLQQPQLTISTFVLSCLFLQKLLLRENLIFWAYCWNLVLPLLPTANLFSAQLPWWLTT